MNDKEKEIIKNMRILKISREEAEQLYIDDHSDNVLPEVAEMEQKAKACGRRYENDINNRKKTERIPILDSEKVEIINLIAKDICHLKIGNDKIIESIQIINAQREISFNIKDTEYSLTLTKHRKKREDNKNV